MTELNEGELSFRFECRTNPFKYDEMAFYRNQFQAVCEGAKAVDFLCKDGSCGYLVEVKDYAQAPRTKPSDLPQEIAEKVRDTLAGLVACKANANDHEERGRADQWLSSTRLRVVLHLEQPKRPSRLKPRVAEPQDLRQKLKQLLKAIDAHPMVADCAHTPSDVPWSVARRQHP